MADIKHGIAMPLDAQFRYINEIKKKTSDFGTVGGHADLYLNVHFAARSYARALTHTTHNTGMDKHLLSHMQCKLLLFVLFVCQHVQHDEGFDLMRCSHAL